MPTGACANRASSRGPVGKDDSWTSGTAAQRLRARGGKWPAGVPEGCPPTWGRLSRVPSLAELLLELLRVARLEERLVERGVVPGLQLLAALHLGVELGAE